MPKLSELAVCPRIPASRSSGRATLDCRISLVTPLFGGGVEAGTPDESLPIRGTAIRGQLQFWWRATRGAAFSTQKELFEPHADIWGSTDKASSVEVEVLDVEASDAKSCAEYSTRNDGKLRLAWQSPFDRPDRVLPYALFPFQGELEPNGKTVKKHPARYIESASFTLRLRYPERLKKDLRTAVWAWVNFGGLGTRTRRGCGSLFCEELAPKDIGDLQQWLRAGLDGCASSARAWPTMPSSLLVGTESHSPLEAWAKTIGLLRTFRQGVGLARNPGQPSNRPGRSRYPEPETIRRLTGKRSHPHERLQNIPNNAFPRAEFGLPIVFHFKDGKDGDPPDTTLYPASEKGERRERMASPLILKPLALATGEAVPLILRLVILPLLAVELRENKEKQPLPLPDDTLIQGRNLATYKDSPLRHSISGSALDAFCQYALEQSNGFRKIPS